MKTSVLTRFHMIMSMSINTSTKGNYIYKGKILDISDFVRNFRDFLKIFETVSHESKHNLFDVSSSSSLLLLLLLLSLLLLLIIIIIILLLLLLFHKKMK